MSKEIPIARVFGTDDNLIRQLAANYLGYLERKNVPYRILEEQLPTEMSVARFEYFLDNKVSVSEGMPTPTEENIKGILRTCKVYTLFVPAKKEYIKKARDSPIRGGISGKILEEAETFLKSTSLFHK
jgi:hypothetical protein